MDFELRFTDKEITAWGGMGLMNRMLDHMGFAAGLSQSGLPQPGSNRGYPPEQLITQFMLSVWCGANRFEHGEVTRHDPVLKRIFGIVNGCQEPLFPGFEKAVLIPGCSGLR